MKIRNLFILLGIALAFSACQSGAKQEAGETESTEPKSEEMTQPNTLTEAEKQDGWMLLFDGKTTEGWRGYNLDAFPEKGWEIVDGTLHCIGSGRGEAGGEGGDIITNDQFTWYELKLEWKIDTGGNSGVFYQVAEVPDQEIWKSALEMQVLDNENHPDGREPSQQAGALYDMIPAVPQNVRPIGEWNEISILVYKGLVEHWQNGEKVVEYHLWTDDWKEMVLNSKFAEYPLCVEPPETGHIGLQDHGDDVWYRNIKIKVMK